MLTNASTKLGKFGPVCRCCCLCKIWKSGSWKLVNMEVRVLWSLLKPSKPDNSDTKHERLKEVGKILILNKLGYLEIENNVIVTVVSLHTSHFIEVSWIYPTNFYVRYTAQKTRSYNWVLKVNLKMYVFVCFCFCVIIKLNSLAVAFLAIKIKRYLYVSYTQLFDCLHILNIHIIPKYTENENLKR